MPSAPVLAAAIDSANRQFLADVIAGLQQPQKTLPCKYFYDARGSALFEQICALDEYYVTRTEFSILRNSGAAIAAALSPYRAIIEPGAGSCSKVQLLLAAAPQIRQYLPLEISLAALKPAVKRLRQRFPQLDVQAVAGDFTAGRCLADIAERRNQQRSLVFFPGSTIGNFANGEAIAVLNSLRQLAGDNGAVLLGADLIKDQQRLLAAYDDAEGITAEFNKNILRRINRELDADFDIEHGFGHRAVFNEALQRVEMHLVARREQRVRIAGKTFQLRPDETIHTENSHKYTAQSIAQMAASAGLELTQHWRDLRGDFGLFLLSAH